LIGFPPGHPRAKQVHQNLKSNSNNSLNAGFKMPTANNVSGIVSDEVGPSVTLSGAQFNKFLAALSNMPPRPSQHAGTSPKANAVTKPSLSKVFSRNWIIDSGATDYITSSSELLHKDNH
jgi:hypothetical protein